MTCADNPDERKVWRTPRAGSLARLALAREPMPERRPGHRRIRVEAVGLNFADVFALVGLYSATPEGAFVPGLECAGVDEDTGERLIVLTRFGGYASRLDADPRHCLPLPADWSFAEGAAYAAQALTALYALQNLGAVAPGHTVLVHSAAGGVGLNALALCRKLGARAIGSVGSPAKLPFLRGQGYDDVFVREASIVPAVRERLAGGELNLVLDAVGGRVFRESYALLSPTGRMVTFGAAEFAPRGARVDYLAAAWRYLRRPKLDPLAMISDNKAVLGFNLIWLWEKMAMLAPLRDELVRLGPVRPHVGRTFPFAAARQALDFLKSGASVGKVVLLLTLACAFWPAARADELLVRGVAVFDGSAAAVSPPQDVLVRDGTVAALGPALAAAPGARVLDGRGKGWTLLPGLVDLHAHLGGSGAFYGHEVAIEPLDNARTQLYAGVTAVADLLSEPDLLTDLRAAGKAEPLPRLFFAGPAFAAPGGHGGWGKAHLIGDGTPVGPEFDRHLSYRPDLTKAILENALWLRLAGKAVAEKPTLTEAALGEIARRSRAAGLPLFVHVWSLEHAKLAVRQKADVLAHGVFTSELDAAFILAAKAAGTAVVPTLSVVLGSRAPLDPTLTGATCPALLASLRDPALAAAAAKANPLGADALGPETRFLTNTAKLFQAGIPLGIGTDAGNPLALHGPTVHQEIDRLVAAGIPLAAVMRLATAGSAALLGPGAAKLGRVAPGFAANLLVVEGDPLSDPKAHTRIVQVILDGALVDRDALARKTTRKDCGIILP